MDMAKLMKNILIVSDTHSGHQAGLTPPQYWMESLKSNDPSIAKRAMILKAIWEFWEKIAKSKKWDYLFSIGDLIDGKGQKSGGIEQLTTDRKEQCDMAVQALKLAKSKTIRMVRGTPYHTGEEENFEDFVADALNAEIKDHFFLNVDGVIFDLKHKIGGSSIPHGRATPIMRSSLWSQLWAERGLAPNPDILIRGHVHYFTCIKDFYKTCFTMPCLQWDSRYGKLNCEGTIDLGVIEMQVDKGHYSILPHQLDMKFAKAEAEKI
jgi:predicted phosphodiesterase